MAIVKTCTPNGLGDVMVTLKVKKNIQETLNNVNGFHFCYLSRTIFHESQVCLCIAVRIPLELLMPACTEKLSPRVSLEEIYELVQW